MHELEAAKSILLNENTHITHKMRALFTLRNILTDESALVICEAFKFKSILLKHELAYVLGQMRLEISLLKLISVLQDESENEIVRHECAEALGNFDYSDKESILSLLKKYFDHKSIPLRETAFLSYNKLKRNENKISIFNSYDPTMPLQQKYSFEEISEIFLNKDTDLYLKYEILFYLRDLCSEEAIKLLGLGMNDQSDLFKHEIAFVIGQIANNKPENVSLAVDFLVKELENRNNHPMVRHECAESLGAICNDYTNEVLLRYVDDECEVVKESCLVALDISDYKVSEEGEYCVKVE